MTQYSLPLRQEIDPSIVRSKRTFWAAVELAIEIAGVEEDKQVYLPLGLDKAQWSRISNGKMHFPHERITDLCGILGNDIPIEWLAYQRGKGLHLLETEAERLIREKDEQIADLTKRLEWTIGIAQGKAPAN